MWNFNCQWSRRLYCIRKDILFCNSTPTEPSVTCYKDLYRDRVTIPKSRQIHSQERSEWGRGRVFIHPAQTNGRSTLKRVLLRDGRSPLMTILFYCNVNRNTAMVVSYKTSYNTSHLMISHQLVEQVNVQITTLYMIVFNWII